MRAHSSRGRRAGSTGDLRDDDQHELVARIDLVSRIQRIEGDLTAAERRVADAVAADYEATTRMSISDLANRRGSVSQALPDSAARSAVPPL